MTSGVIINMDCLNCKRALKDTYVVSMGHKLCVGCYRAGVYENEENKCFECQTRDQTTHFSTVMTCSSGVFYAKQ